jgi:3-(3-hydroxy-phenyl)propionate hydroxylase
MEKPIIISGAGPVGLTVADILSQQGIPVIVLEKNEGPSKEWRASTFHAGTLELLESTGLADELIEQGMPVDLVQYRDREKGVFAEFDFNLLKDETKYPFRLQCPQSTYVKVVYERLKKRSNVEVRFNTEVVDFKQDENIVNVTIQTPNGTEQLRSEYFLGADGAKSTIRKNLGFSFDGYTYEERFLLVGTTSNFTDYIPDIANVNYISDPDEFLFILRVPEAWRLLYPIKPNTPDEVALDPVNIQRSLQSILKTEDDFPIVERMIYRVHQRVSNQFYNGRVILLGDAAHVNSPMGGLGLNSGIHDAVDLSRRLIRILNGSEAEPELQKYNELRRKVALDYVKTMTEKNTQVMKETNPEHRLALQKEFAKQAEDPILARKWCLNSSLITSVRELGIGEPPALKHV